MTPINNSSPQMQQNAFEVSTPPDRIQMDRSYSPRPTPSENYEMQVIAYRNQQKEFESSPCRMTAMYLGGCLGLAGTGGCCVAGPIVQNMVAGNTATCITMGSSTLACVIGGVLMYLAKIPSSPTHPDAPRPSD